jgi:hypothetical protein
MERTQVQSKPKYKDYIESQPVLPLVPAQVALTARDA